jgi:hypothetical protein
VVDALWTHSNFQSTYLEEVTDHTTTIPLSYFNGHYVGSITVNNLASGSHTMVLYALGEKNIMSFYEYEWGAFSDLVSFTMAETDVALPIENTWQVITPMPTARFNLGVAAVDGKIYAVGGETSSGATGANEMYNPETDMWTTKQPMPYPITGFSVTVCQNKIYCIGRNYNQVYDPATDSWTTKASMPTPRSYLCICEVNDKIYAISGWKTNTQYNTFGPCTLNEMYDPETDTWTSMATLPDMVAVQVAVAFNGKIYAFADYICEIYNPTTNSWSISSNSKTKSATSGTGAATSGVTAPANIYLFRGDGTAYFNPQAETYTSGANMPAPHVYSSGVAVVNDVFYVIGGKTSKDVPLNVNYKYIPLGYAGSQTPSPADTPTPVSTPTPDAFNGNLLNFDPTEILESKNPDPALPFSTLALIAAISVVVVATPIVSFSSVSEIQQRYRDNNCNGYGGD